MQNIVTYISRNGVKGSIVDAYNMPQRQTPSITIGMAACLKLHIFEHDGEEPLPASQFASIASWNFALDKDYDRSTGVLLRAVTGIQVEEDGTISIPLPDTNVQNLITAIGKAESATYTAELAGYENGSSTPVMVLQFPLIVHNRIDPEPGAESTAVTPSTLTLAQITALLGAELDFQFSVDGDSWHSTQTSNDVYFRARNSSVQNAAWSASITIPKGTDGNTVAPDLVAPIADRPNSPSEGFCFVSSDEGKVYWFKSGSWTAGAPLTTVEGPQGIQGIQGPQGETATIEIGTITSVSYGESPSVENVGTSTAAKLNFVLPQGPQGPQGIQGVQGLQGDIGPAGDGLAIDATGTLANRHEYDNAPAKFRYMATDFYTDTVTTALGKYQRTPTLDTSSAYAWHNESLTPATIFTDSELPSIGQTAGATVNNESAPQVIIDIGEKYQLYYQKRSDSLGHWSQGFRLNIGPEGPQGPQGVQGERGPAGENATVTPDLEFLYEQDEESPATPYISDNALIITGTRPIADVIRYIDDTDTPGHIEGIRATSECVIRVCFDEAHTIVYFNDASDWALGGRIRFAQGIQAVSPYQEYLENGGTDTYLEWYARLTHGVTDAPHDGKLYARCNGQWVEITGNAGGSGTSGDSGNSGDETVYAYYGVINDGTTYAVSQVTAAMAKTLTKADVSQIVNPVTLASVPAGAVLFLAVPSGYGATKDDGLGGQVAFATDNGTTSTGANGGASTLEIDGVTYDTYGEFRLSTADALIYIEENQ